MGILGHYRCLEASEQFMVEIVPLGVEVIWDGGIRLTFNWCSLNINLGGATPPKLHAHLHVGPHPPKFPHHWRTNSGTVEGR